MIVVLWMSAALLLVGGGALVMARLAWSERQVAIASHVSELQATAELKSEAIRHWRAERSAATQLLALSPRVAHPKQLLSRGDPTGTHRRELQSEVDRLRLACADCVSLTVLDLEGRTVTASSAPGATASGPTPPTPAFPALSGFHGDATTGGIRLTLVAPILDDDEGQEQAYGTLVSELDPAIQLFPMLRSWPTTSRTGEVGLVERQGDEVVILLLTRNRPAPDELVRIAASRIDSPAVQAAGGDRGLIEGVDSHGAPVLAVARAVEGTPWTLVAKEDVDEVLAAYRERMRLYAVTLAGLLLAVAGLFAFLRQRRRVRAIRREGMALAEELEARRLLNLELTHGELRFRSLVLATAQIVWTADADGEVVDDLPAWRSYTGMTPAQVRGLGWLAAVHPDDARRVEQVWRAAVATRSPYRTWYRLRRHDGQFGSFDVQGVPVIEDDGRVAEWIGTCTDISQRLEAEEALRRSELWQRRLIESLGVGVVVHAADTRVVTANPEACRVLGLNPDQLRGTAALPPTWRFLREDASSLPEQEHPASQVVASRRPLSGLVLGVDRGDGSPPGWVLANAYAINDAQGHLENVVVSFSDITSQRSAEAEAARLAEHLRVSQKIEALGRLAGGVAHDFNNMLSVILGHTAFALEAVGEVDPIREDLVEVEKAGRRAAALTRQLLAFGRRQVLQPRPLDLNHVVDEMEKMLRRLIGEDVRLEKSLAAGLWPTLADPTQVEQVIMNLAINARDAMPGGGRLAIATGNLSLDRSPGGELTPGDYVALTVTDSGAGFDAATRARLFEPFFTTKAQGKGTGLGLSTVHGIVSQSGGQIQVESEPGRGSTFRVLLPRAHAGAGASSALPASRPAVARGGETILVVEDESAVRDVTRRILEAAGYRVLAADGGGAALRLCREHAGELHLLLSDVVMPQMGGPECAAAAQALRPGLRVLFMSGYAEDAISHQGVLQPGTPLLGKPFGAAELTRQVRQVLDGPARPAPEPTGAVEPAA